MKSLKIEEVKNKYKEGGLITWEKIWTKKEVIEEIKNFIESQAEIIFAYIFGSFVENETFNDIDLAIYIDENIISTRKIFYEI